MRKKRRALAALGIVAAGTLGAFRAVERLAFFEEKTATAANWRAVAAPEDGVLTAPNGFKAFLVGADDYGEAIDLAFVKNDVEAFAARLLELGFEENNVTILKTGDDFAAFPTKNNIEERFKTFVDNLREGDFAIVYLSGHGIQPTNSSEAFFAPIDVKARKPFATSVSIDKMLEALERSDANFRWMIVDACRDDPSGSPSPAIFKTRSPGAKGLTKIANAPKSTSLLQSCQPGQFSYEGGEELKNGLFTLSLLEALDKNEPKADFDADGALAFSEVFKYVTERTNELALKYYGVSQKPNWSGTVTDFVILNDLLRDGLTQARWREADGLYRLARKYRRERAYSQAAEKIAEARKINAVNPEYKEVEEEIAEILRLQDEAEKAALAQAEAERKVKEAADGRASAEQDAETAATQTAASNGARPGAAESAESTESADGGWTETYEAGTAKSLEIKGKTYVFRYCPAGKFMMGSPEDEPDRHNYERRREVTLTKGFWLLETEVTQALWESVMEENPSYFAPKGAGYPYVDAKDTSDFPVDQINWRDCKDFIAKLNEGGFAPDGLAFRLPTEAEWEYACRAGTTEAYACGGLGVLGAYAWHMDNSGGHTHKVKQKLPNPWGLRDMCGNVAEWCEDAVGAILDETVDPKGPTPDPTEEVVYRILRGGSWGEVPGFCRSANRFYNNSEYACPHYGMRLALSAER